MGMKSSGSPEIWGRLKQKFKETVNAKNTFLTDPDAKVINAYGALNATNKNLKPVLIS